MKHLSIDIETFSSVDILSCGAHKYIESPDFEILLFSYSIDFGPVVCIDLAQGEKLPQNIISALTDPAVTKHAYNAIFEITAINKIWKTDHRQWIDTMVLGLYQALPAGLAMVGQALGLPEDKKKLAAGKALIRYFSVPCRETKANGGRTRNLPHHDPEKWNLYKEYNRQDVVTEMEVYRRLADMADFPDREMYYRDLMMNTVGVRVDMDLVNQIIADDTACRERLMAEAKALTGLSNPNSAAQLLPWLKQFCDISDLRAETVASKIAGMKAGNQDHHRNAIRVLEIRQALSKTSIKKYYTIADAVCADGRVKGLLQYYGTSTGRWAGRLVQVQNLKRNNLICLDEVRSLAKAGNTDAIEAIYGDLSDVHSQLCRTAFIPDEGKHFVVADFSAIEARVLAWLAGEAWVLGAFRNGKDIYCETAAQMFGVPVEKHGQNGHLRQKGKIAVLALGYGGGPSAMLAMGADKMGLSADELADIVQKYRTANSNIRKFWYACNRAAIDAAKTGRPQKVRSLAFQLESFSDGRRALSITLPSGRKIYYQNPHIVTNRFGSESLGFDSLNMAHQWAEEETYGGKIVENITQAVARDCLAEVMLRIPEDWPKGRIVMHIHDEIVVEADLSLTVDDVCKIMSRPIRWAPDLPLSAAGFEGKYYMKD